MDIRKVKKLIELLEESGIAEIEISEGEESVRISRYPTGGAPAQAPVVHYAAPASAPAPAATAAPAAPAQQTASAPAPAPRADHTVTAPIGRYLLCSADARREALRRDRQRSQCRRHALHHRSDEDDESDRVRQSRARHGHPRQERRSGRIRAAVVHHRIAQQLGSGRRTLRTGQSVPAPLSLPARAQWPEPAALK